MAKIVCKYTALCEANKAGVRCYKNLGCYDCISDLCASHDITVKKCIGDSNIDIILSGSDEDMTMFLLKYGVKQVE